MKKFIVVISFFLFINSLVFSQGTAGEEGKYEYRYLIDMPSSGILQKGFVGVSNDILPAGVVVGRIEVGVFDDVSFGISYGGGNIIGSGSPKWYKYPGINLRIRIMEESVKYPSLSVGFDSQGKGDFYDSSSRFQIKSPGFFASASKNFEFLGYLSLHASVNYSLESKDGDNYLNLMAGFEKTIGKKISLVLEYDFALNDNATNLYGNGNGYLNMGVRWTVGEGFTLGLDIRDLLSNKKWSPGSADRGIKLEYIKNIFTN